MAKKLDNLKAAFGKLRKLGVYSKMNIGDNLEDAYFKLYDHVNYEESDKYFGFVGFSIIENRARKKQNLIPITWGIVDRVNPDILKVRQQIVTILEEYGIITDADKKLKLSIQGVDDKVIIIAEDQEKFDLFRRQMEAAKSSFVNMDTTCTKCSDPYYSGVTYKVPQNIPHVENPTQYKNEKFIKTIAGMKRGSDFLSAIKLVGRPDRKEPINYTDIEYLQKLNRSDIDVDVFVRLV